MRVNIKAIMADEAARKRLLVGACIAIQAREGIDTTHAQMEAAYDKIHAELALKKQVLEEVLERIKHIPPCPFDKSIWNYGIAGDGSLEIATQAPGRSTRPSFANMHIISIKEGYI